MTDSTWTVLSIDQSSGHMVVEYVSPDGTVSLNIPLPKVNADVNAHLSMYAPVPVNVELFAPIEVGSTGKVEILSPPETPNVAGNLNEEYMRAMIYQVLEEIKESAV